MSRQVGYAPEEESGDEDEILPDQGNRNALAGVYEEAVDLELTTTDEEFVGFNGRCNKTVDTCYAFWVTASLDVFTFFHHCFPTTDYAFRYWIHHTTHSSIHRRPKGFSSRKHNTE